MRAGNHSTFSYALLVTIFIVSHLNYGFCHVKRNTHISTVASKKLKIEELINIEVTPVSMRPEKLNEAASAIQVITNENNRAPFAKTLAGGISAPGSNNVLANKLFVLIDGGRNLIYVRPAELIASSPSDEVKHSINV
ncbi:MAG: hypothetical protein ABIO76_07990, partial [Ginsengibacter sp.]